MSISLKLSYIALKLTYTLGLQVYPVSLNPSNMHSSLRKLDRWDAHLTSLDTSLRLNQSAKKAIETTKPALAEFIKEQRPNDPDPIVWDVSAVADALGAEIIDELPLCSNGCGPMILKQGTKEGKEYRGWVCPVPKSGHPAKWMRIGSDGHWVFQK
jgi:hypothetical protein